MDNSNAGDITLNSQNNIENVSKFLEKNDIEGAKNFLKNFLAVNSENMQAMFIMAQLLETEGNFTEAADLYEKVFANKIPPEFEERVIHVFEISDKYEKLYDIFKVKHDENPNDLDIRERFANICSILGKTDETIELYNSILAKSPDNIVALRQLADIYEQANPMMFHSTTAKIAQLEDNYEKAEKEYKKAFTLAEKDEDILQIRYQLASVYREQGKNEHALDEYIFILSATDSNFRVFIDLAEIYIELSNPDSAISVLKRALRVYPDNLEATQLLADTLLDKEEFDLAKNYFEKLVGLDETNVENKVSLAKIYLNLNKIEQTKDILLKAEKQSPSSTEVLTAMAGFYTFTNEFEKAKGYCNRIIQKYPASPLGYKKLAQLYYAMNEKQLSHINFGIYHEMRNEYEDAVNEYNIALQYKRDDFETIKRLARLHEKLNEIDFAIDYYHKLFEAKIDYPETTKKIVSMYMAIKEYEMAQRYIEAALKETNNIELEFLNAKCMYKLKDFEGALETLNHYKENTTSIENVEETDKLIEAIEHKKEDSYNPFAKLFKFLDK